MFYVTISLQHACLPLSKAALLKARQSMMHRRHEFDMHSTLTFRTYASSGGTFSCLLHFILLCITYYRGDDDNEDYTLVLSRA